MNAALKRIFSISEGKCKANGKAKALENGFYALKAKAKANTNTKTNENAKANA